MNVSVGELLFEQWDYLLEVSGLEPVHALRVRLLNQHCPVGGPDRDRCAAVPLAPPGRSHGSRG